MGDGATGIAFVAIVSSAFGRLEKSLGDSDDRELDGDKGAWGEDLGEESEYSENSSITRYVFRWEELQ